jgi:hypothetical protein
LLIYIKIILIIQSDNIVEREREREREMECVPYISELWQAMIILKDCYISEFIYSFGGADGSLWVIQNPLFNQIKTKLHIQDKTNP